MSAEPTKFCKEYPAVRDLVTSPGFLRRARFEDRDPEEVLAGLEIAIFNAVRLAEYEQRKAVGQAMRATDGASDQDRLDKIGKHLEAAGALLSEVRWLDRRSESRLSAWRAIADAMVSLDGIRGEVDRSYSPPRRGARRKVRLPVLIAQLSEFWMRSTGRQPPRSESGSFVDLAVRVLLDLERLRGPAWRAPDDLGKLIKNMPRMRANGAPPNPARDQGQ